MKKLLILTALILTGCDKLSFKTNVEIHHESPPPGFSLACDGKGNYTMFELKDGGFVNTCGDGAIFKTRQETIDWEWKFYEFDSTYKQPDTSMFHECPKTKKGN